MMRAIRNTVTLTIAMVLLCTLPCDSLAQLRGAYPPGFAALESGTQGPPGIDVVVPAFI